ncbi:hypothetical protein COCNU_scaffold003255G000010 [Cocos nucifera]|nr:hypothetical protein [Cocos nucifera]
MEEKEESIGMLGEAGEEGGGGVGGGSMEPGPSAEKSAGSIAERRAAWSGFNPNPRLNTARFRSISPLSSPGVRSPFVTIPPGLSPTALLDSPGMLPNSQVAYDPYGYGYDASETSSFNGYYHMQSGASYGLDFVAGIFGWAPSQPYYHPKDTSQSQSLSERSEMSYNPERLPYGMNIQDYRASWMEGWIDIPLEYENDLDIHEHHRYSIRF